jgi:hypothetical protein
MKPVVRRFELRGLMTSSTQPWSQSSDCYERKKAHADIDLAWSKERDGEKFDDFAIGHFAPIGKR